MMRLRVILITALVIVVSSHAFSADQSDTSADKLSLHELFPKLGADKWKDRQAAKEELLAIGRLHPEPVLRKCVDALVRSNDPEVTYLSKSILQKLVIEKLFPERAFLGIRMQNSTSTTSIKGQKFVPVTVTEVLPDTAAAAAKMSMGDRILKVDKNVCSRRFGSRHIITYISSKKPGYTIDLMLLSEGEVISKQVELRARPSLPGEIPIDTQKKRFFENWLSEELRKARKFIRPSSE